MKSSLELKMDLLNLHSARHVKERLALEATFNSLEGLDAKLYDIVADNHTTDDETSRRFFGV